MGPFFSSDGLSPGAPGASGASGAGQFSGHQRQALSQCLPSYLSYFSEENENEHRNAKAKAHLLQRMFLT